jgi:hypothetical protein
MNSQMAKELLGMSRVLAGDQVDAAERLHGPKRNIAKISDRRGDEIEDSGHAVFESALGRARLEISLLKFGLKTPGSKKARVSMTRAEVLTILDS